MSKDPRDAQRQFAADKFRWLDQVAADGELPPLAARLCITFCRFFSLEYDGRAWAYQDTMAEVLGVKRWSINKVLQALVERGHLTSVRRGRDKPNHYHFVLKDEDHDVCDRTHHNDHDVRSSTSRCAPQHTQTPCTNPGTPSASPGERGGAAAPPPGGAGAPPGWRKKGKAVAVLSKEQSAMAAALEALHAVWQRGWPKDATAKQHAADRQAFGDALRHGTAYAIIDGAEAWVKAADAPRFLPLLSDWLAARSWEKPPPKKKVHAGNGHSRRRHNGGKVDVAKTMLKVGAGWLENEDGDLMNPDTGAIWENNR
jgi:hypothetical protein